MRRQTRNHGFTLVELLLVIAIAGLATAIATPAFLTMQRRAAVRAAAGEIRAIFGGCRARAVTRSRNAGVKFVKTAAGWTYALYDDGNGDGVRNQDISSGVDPQIAAPRLALVGSRSATIGLPSFTIRDPDGELMPPSRPPVQFGNSAIASFSPLGAATAGTLYLTDGEGDVYAVRLYGATAKVRTLRYVRQTQKWVAAW